ncbi:hypothetical protein, partial [Streptomyces sp. NBC_01283]|uniref:hypothetical protein n=1 Tax=Streptomyces sp. NBC_01283 TaxID=2903812 RepID=UPI00352DB6E5
MPRTPNTALQMLMQTAGLSPTQLARALRAVAAEHGSSVVCDHSTVRRWLAGARPRPPAPALLLECLSRSLGRPVTVQEAGLTRAPATTVDPSWEADPVHKLVQLTAAELAPTRRTLASASVFSLAVLLVPDLTLPGGSLTRRGPTGPDMRPGTAEAEHLRSLTTFFFNAAEQYGGQHIRPTLATYLAHHATPLLHAPARERVHRDLLNATAQLTLLLGNLCADSGHDRTAQHYHQVAARLAADANDAATLAIALRTMATHAHDLGHHHPAVLNLAERAAHHARHAPPAIQTYTLAHLGVIQARHDRHTALATVARAESMYRQTDAASGPFTAYPAGALHYQRAQALTALGDHTAALHALT